MADRAELRVMSFDIGRSDGRSLGATIDVVGSRIRLVDAHLQWVEHGLYSLHEKRRAAFASVN